MALKCKCWILLTKGVDLLTNEICEEQWVEKADSNFLRTAESPPTFISSLLNLESQWKAADTAEGKDPTI